MKKKTYKIQSKMNYIIVYGAWIDGSDFCWHDKDGSTICMPRGFYNIIGEW